MRLSPSARDSTRLAQARRRAAANLRRRSWRCLVVGRRRRIDDPGRPWGVGEAAAPESGHGGAPDRRRGRHDARIVLDALHSPQVDGCCRSQQSGAAAPGASGGARGAPGRLRRVLPAQSGLSGGTARRRAAWSEAVACRRGRHSAPHAPTGRACIMGWDVGVRRRDEPPRPSSRGGAG